MSTKQKKNLSNETIAAIRRMIAGVMAEPRFYNQQTFPTASDCGATCCAAGWAVFQKIGSTAYKKLIKSVPMPDCDIDWTEKALDALNLPPDTFTTSLFGRSWEWPAKFYRMYEKAKDPMGRAKAFKARWEHFIEHDGEGLIPVQE